MVEADEFGDNFLNYHPAGAIVTNVEMDHPDYFADAAAVMDSFERFVRGMGTDPALGGRLLLTAADDPGAGELVAPPGRLGGTDRPVRSGWRARGHRRGRSGPTARPSRSSTGASSRSLAGAHNVLNATAALVMARALGADLDLSPMGCARSPEPGGGCS